MRDDAVERATVGPYTVKIVQDVNSESPRDWYNLGTMVCWHRTYSLGDTKKGMPLFASPDDFRESSDYKNAAVILPLYLYDHSGITMSTGPFGDPWDSGQVGYIYVTKDRVRQEYSVKRITKATLRKVTEVLEGEVKTYDMFLTGQVYGYVVENADGEHIDSVWGFFGTEHALTEGKAAAQYQIEQDAKIETMMTS